MNNEILFSERQKFKQWWLWLILAGVNGVLLFGVYKQVILEQPFGDKPASTAGLVAITGLVIAITILFAMLELKTQIRKDGIYVKFFPLHLSFRHYSRDKISKAYVRQYRPIGEYGGWGIRFGLFGKGKAYNVSGDMGLQLEFSDSKKLLIGTNKPEELTATLTQLGELKQ